VYSVGIAIAVAPVSHAEIEEGEEELFAAGLGEDEQATTASGSAGASSSGSSGWGWGRGQGNGSSNSKEADTVRLAQRLRPALPSFRRVKHRLEFARRTPDLPRMFFATGLCWGQRQQCKRLRALWLSAKCRVDL
jgi:hypothetical protein